ncbi:hypothetical protein D1793_08105 [Halomonas sp. JS92-SW72]|nr:hypothetical protein D1793_08105 [Halomonas sp. JS92-SW72]
MALAYFLFARHRARVSPAVNEATPQPEQADKPAEADADALPRTPASGQAVTAHSLFVIFPTPDSETRQAIVTWLRRIEARYDSVLEVYSVPGQQPANPIKVANAFPPGTLPDLLGEEGGDGFELRGLSLLVKPPLRRSRNQQMHVFIELARELEALGGEVLDADRQPATEQTYERILG